MENGYWAVITSSVVGPGAIVFLIWLRDRRKNSAAATKSLAHAQALAQQGEASLAGATLVWARELREELANVKAEVSGLNARLEDVQRENRRLRRHNELLTTQVIDLGGVPVAMPDEDGE